MDILRYIHYTYYVYNTVVKNWAGQRNRPRHIDGYFFYFNITGFF